MVKGFTVKDVPAGPFIKELAKYFQEKDDVKIPEWVDIVKTAVIKELPPVDENWFYVRLATLARRVYLRQNTGVKGFTKVFGGRDRRGCTPKHFSRSSKGVIRYCLKQLGELGLTAVCDKKSGRVITSEGRKLLDTIAHQVDREAPMPKQDASAQAMAFDEYREGQEGSGSDDEGSGDEQEASGEDDMGGD